MKSSNAIKLSLYGVIIVGNILYVDFIWDMTWDFFSEENFMPTDNFIPWQQSKGDAVLVAFGISLGMAIILLYTPLIWAASKTIMLITRQFRTRKKNSI